MPPRTGDHPGKQVGGGRERRARSPSVSVLEPQPPRRPPHAQAAADLTAAPLHGGDGEDAVHDGRPGGWPSGSASRSHRRMARRASTGGSGGHRPGVCWIDGGGQLVEEGGLAREQGRLADENRHEIPAGGGAQERHRFVPEAVSEEGHVVVRAVLDRAEAGDVTEPARLAPAQLEDRDGAGPPASPPGRRGRTHAAG